MHMVIQTAGFPFTIEKFAETVICLLIVSRKAINALLFSSIQPILFFI